ncbi:hypothetical protein [Geobacillus sp. B4113_201601]|uniref:hypothetical protein n=1 Tax=Geobacillus sp. B4113_201601 TaxID=1586290 RepID=UPI000783BC49|nr:hypothetical protein [Geobacillus sp. B4113_201601]KYD30055.1 hypothetical protein B4113_1088 [Geobacillus sp. B4113_201601]
MYKIKTPNENYNGVTYGIKFTNGLGETDSEEIKNILIHDFGYELVYSDTQIEEQKEQPKQTSKKSPTKKG